MSDPHSRAYLHTCVLAEPWPIGAEHTVRCHSHAFIATPNPQFKAQRSRRVAERRAISWSL